MNLFEFELAQILISEHSTSQVIVLQEKDGKRRLSIEIGSIEAMSINNAVHEYEYTRPLTHDLISNILTELSTPLKHIIISEIRSFETGAIFYAQMILEKNGSEISIDCRPSDAIAIAVRCDCKIFIAEEVLDIAAD